MDALPAILAITVAIALLFELARRLQVPWPSLFVLGGLALGFVPGLPRFELEPELVLLVFLPPLLFVAAIDSPVRDLKTDVWPIARLSILLVLITTAVVGSVMHFVAGLDWAPALAFGAIVGPTDALAATAVFRRIPIPRRIVALIEGESLFNDATALVAYRTAVIATVSGAFVLADAVAGFAVAAIGGIVIGLAVGWLSVQLYRRLHDPPVEVVISLVIPFAAYLPAERLGLSGVLASVAAGLVIGSRLGTIIGADTRVLWLSTWKMVNFVLNGFLFVLIGLQLPEILAGVKDGTAGELIGLILLICFAVIATRFAYVELASRLPNGPRAQIARYNAELARRLTIVFGWSGLRGAVSLAAALALPVDFPERNLILLLTFSVIVVTLVGQGLTLPYLARWAAWDGVEFDGDELTRARGVAYEAGLAEIARARQQWPDHLPLLDRLESGLRDRTDHLATEDADETAERHQERIEHEQIQREVIAAQRAAVIELRDRRSINDRTLRLIERDLDLEELRAEG
ncbi:MAG TPA: Na+/H+ antiporter [Patescibacteria group bacterium]|nr:Na+/H+ antiporter [Patescibacteria group bacterium]